MVLNAGFQPSHRAGPEDAQDIDRRFDRHSKSHNFEDDLAVALKSCALPNRQKERGIST